MHHNNLKAWKIGTLWHSRNGTIEKHHFHEDINFETDDLKVSSKPEIDFELIKHKNTVTCHLKLVKLGFEPTCSRCLELYQDQVKFTDSGERVFQIFDPALEGDSEDHYFLNSRDLTINLYDFLREEIILHFPLIPVCSKSCKGLCASCGVNLNQQKHKKDCHTEKQDIDSVNKPFSQLKDLIN